MAHPSICHVRATRTGLHHFVFHCAVMSWMSEMPDKHMDEIAQMEAASVMATPKGGTPAPTMRANRGAWNSFEKEGLAFHSTAHEQMATQDFTHKEMRAKMATPAQNPACPSLSGRMSPGTAALKRSEQRGKNATARGLVGGDRRFEQAHIGLCAQIRPPATLSAEHTAELRGLKSDLQKAMLRCDKQMRAVRRSQGDTRALQELSAQQQAAVQAVELELQSGGAL